MLIMQRGCRSGQQYKTRARARVVDLVNVGLNYVNMENPSIHILLRARNDRETTNRDSITTVNITIASKIENSPINFFLYQSIPHRSALFEKSKMMLIKYYVPKGEAWFDR